MKASLSMLIGVFVMAAASLSAGETVEKKYDPIEQYEKREVEGWTVLVNKTVLPDEKKELRERTLRILGEHLHQITRVVPPGAVEALRKVPIWLELSHPWHPCMCYHESPDWLRDNNMNPQKAGAVELANCENFVKWTVDQPWMVFHELAHAYHHQVLKFDNVEVRACYKSAVEKGLYDSVLRINGKKERAYALSNHKEYFAEMSEAFFGTNDFYPFVRAELKEHDPEMFAVLEKVWGVRKAEKR